MKSLLIRWLGGYTQEEWESHCQYCREKEAEACRYKKWATEAETLLYGALGRLLEIEKRAGKLADEASKLSKEFPT